MKPTLHVPALPHTVTHDGAVLCVFTGILLRFCRMMVARGYRVIHYGNEGSVVPCEHVDIFSRADQERVYGKYDWFRTGALYCAPWEPEVFAEWNAHARWQIAARAHQRDFVCIIGGGAQRALADIPGTLAVEYSVGYDGVFSGHRAFTSYAWMHHIYGLLAQRDGSFFDAVIPPSVEPRDFAIAPRRGEYLLFMSRMTLRKGYQVAVDVARKSGRRLLIAGGTGARVTDSHVEHVGIVGLAERRKLLAEAHAVLVPTLYLEPFGLVAVEAMMSGVPAITTDFGGFTETVQHGVTGYRCRTEEHFLWAIDHAKELSPDRCRAWAEDRYAPSRIGAMYDEWFATLSTLWDEGFYAGRKRMGIWDLG